MQHVPMHELELNYSAGGLMPEGRGVWFGILRYVYMQLDTKRVSFLKHFKISYIMVCLKADGFLSQ